MSVRRFTGLRKGGITSGGAHMRDIDNGIVIGVHQQSEAPTN